MGIGLVLCSAIGSACEGERSFPRQVDEVKREILIARLRAAIADTGLAERSGQPRLAALGGEWKVGDILSATELGRGRYFIAYLQDREGTIAAILLGDEGELRGYQGPAWGDEPTPILRSIDLATGESAVASLVRTKSAVVVLERRYVHAAGSLQVPGASPYYPLVYLRRSDGDYFVNNAGRVFRQIRTAAATEMSIHDGRLLLFPLTGDALELEEITVPHVYVGPKRVDRPRLRPGGTARQESTIEDNGRRRLLHSATAAPSVRV